MVNLRIRRALSEETRLCKHSFVAIKWDIITCVVSCWNKSYVAVWWSIRRAKWLRTENIIRTFKYSWDTIGIWEWEMLPNIQFQQPSISLLGKLGVDSWTEECRLKRLANWNPYQRLAEEWWWMSREVFATTTNTNRGKTFLLSANCFVFPWNVDPLKCWRINCRNNNKILLRLWAGMDGHNITSENAN